MHVLASTFCALAAIAVAAPSAKAAPWREPGQIIDADYLRNGKLRYTAEGREIVGRNRTCFNNRPLYCQPQTDGVVLAGDRPFVRLIGHSYVFGGFSAAILRAGAGKWFHDCAEVESRYHCGRMLWRIADPSLPGVMVKMETVPASDAAGFAVKVNATGLWPGDKLVWAFSGAIRQESLRERWDPVAWGNPFVRKIGDPRKPELSLGIVPEWCKANRVTVEGQTFRLSASADAAYEVVGRSDRAGRLFVADAPASANPAVLGPHPNPLPKGEGTNGDQLPMICGVLDLRTGQDELYWAVEAAPAKNGAATRAVAAPARVFRGGLAYLESIERVRTETPDARLDAAVAAVCHPMDAACNRNPFVFQHGCMSFHIPFLGWRVICGSTALGWHDRVKGNAAYYIAAQVKEDNARTQPEADAERRLCHEGQQSRFYGRGHISNSPGMYNTQSQFFDQTIRDWRWTGDRELEKMLRPALELHLEWARQCFDPDDDGLYESYINTLPTDSVWYNGGGSVEETAYAYYGHRAAADMARRAGDVAAAERHKARADKTLGALHDKFWLKDRGHFGAYVEQGGHHRVHEDAWVYSVFLPIDAGMTTPVQAARSLFFTEWGLERIHLPFGGQLCQPSNWVPSKWSVRDMFGGDMWHLALAYFQTGLGDDGWELLNGAMLESAYAGAMPGGFSQIGAGADFADCKDMFARAVVEGLFGFHPDYPNGVVSMWPALPSSWPRASIRTPDYSFDFRQDGGVDKYRLTLARAAKVEFRLPVRAESVRRVTVNGYETTGWLSAPGYCCTNILLSVPESKGIDVAIELTGRVAQNPPKWIEAAVGEQVRFDTPRGRIRKLPYSPDDWPTTFLRDYRPTDSTISGRLADRPGWHRVLALVTVGELPQWQVYKLHVTDPKREAEMAAKTPREAPRDARWTCLDLTPRFNGDIRTIFEQQYLSPRPKTCSVRIGVDGYSAWTFPYWGLQPPEIDLCNLAKLAARAGNAAEIITPQNVAFHRPAESKNIAFTSLWDNWPRSVSVPVGKRAEAAWLLVCGSTNPMQTRIANAEVRFRYADGKTERLELTPPLNFWSLCPFGGADYDYRTDAFCLPKQPPPCVQLGNNCRAMVLSWKLRPAAELESVTLETLSQDVVIGLMGVSLMNPAK